MSELKCPECGSKYIVLNGRIERKRRSVQRYKCNNCGESFLEKTQRFENKQYSPNVILEALTVYNSGLSLQETCSSVNKRFHVSISPQLVSSWLKEYGGVCSYWRIRKGESKLGKKYNDIENEGIIGLKGQNVIFSRKLEHGQVYEFCYHSIKVEKFINRYFANLRKFLYSVDKECPNELFLQNGNRGSQIKISMNPKIDKKKNDACLLADLVLRANKDNKKRHSEIQRFLLCNDSSTLAVEVPVWLYPDEFSKFRIFNDSVDFGGIDLSKAITGHIDIIQNKFGLIYILDYKPNAAGEWPIGQLFFYAFALSVRTGIWMRNIKCAWFDELSYYEFSPSEIILQTENGISNKERKKYVLDYGRQLGFQRKMFDNMKREGYWDAARKGWDRKGAWLDNGKGWNGKEESMETNANTKNNVDYKGGKNGDLER